MVEHEGTFDLESMQGMMDEHEIEQFIYYPYSLEVRGQFGMLTSDTVIEDDWYAVGLTEAYAGGGTLE